MSQTGLVTTKTRSYWKKSSVILEEYEIESNQSEVNRLIRNPEKKTKTDQFAKNKKKRKKIV